MLQLEHGGEGFAIYFKVQVQKTVKQFRPGINLKM